MIAIAIILLVTGYTVAHFYLKFSPITAFVSLMAAIFGSIAAFNYYEILANLFISRGYGGAWAWAGSFLAIFAFSFALLRELFDRLSGGNIDLGKNVKIAAAIGFGTMTGLTISGNILVGLGMLPMKGSFAYDRFSGTTLTEQNIKASNYYPDNMVSGIFSLFSRDSKKSFAVVSADFINRNHINRYGLDKDVSPLVSSKALSVPGGGKKPVRTMEIPEVGTVTVVRAHISFSDINDGGARNDKGVVSFLMAQVRMIAKPSERANSLGGSGEAVYPVGILQGGKLEKKNLTDIIALSSEQQNEDQNVWLDFVFNVPNGKQGALLQFKSNAMVQLPAPVPSSDEIEKALGPTASPPQQEAPEENSTITG